MAGWLRTTLFRCWLGVSVIITAVTLLAAYGGWFDPRSHAFPAILSMSFPFWIISLAIVAAANLLICKKMALAQWIAAVLCVGAINDYCPLNLFHSTEVAPCDSTRMLKVMTYNTFGFVDDDDIYPDGTNRTASAIIASKADVVFLQEIGFISDMPARHLTQEQVDSLLNAYPHSMFNESKMVGILSRYPLEWVELPQPESMFSGFEGAKLTVNGTELLIVSLHLQSLGLNQEDRLVYHDLTSGDNVSDWKTAGKIIYDKISAAMKHRASQAEMLRAALDSVGIPNMILAGDFNDINGCYAMRKICGENLKSTYSSVGCGPAVTYHKDRFLFNIDHLLYGGAVEPVEIRIGTNTSSDHYPVYATYLIGPKE